MSVRTIKVGTVEIAVSEGSALARVLDEKKADTNGDGVFSIEDITQCETLECAAVNGTQESRFMHTLSLGFAESGIITYEQRNAFEKFFLLREEVREYHSFVNDICTRGTASSFWNEFELDCTEWNALVTPRIASGMSVFSEVREREYRGRGHAFTRDLYWVINELAGNDITYIPEIGNDACADDIYGLAYNESAVPEIIRPLFTQMVQSYLEANNQLENAIGSGYSTFEINSECGDTDERTVRFTGPLSVIKTKERTHGLETDCPDPS